jgi:hypothetical protein
MKYQIRIDWLVLDGLNITRHHGALVQAAVEAELSRLFTEGGLSPALLSGGAIPAVPGGIVATRAAQNPAALGQQIARAVYGGIGT